MKRLTTILALLLAGIGVLLLALGLLVEARFRPADKTTIVLTADTGYLQGSVTEPTGAIPFFPPGIGNATISLSPGDQNTATDDDGGFTIRDVLPGVYTVRIDADGFEPAIINGIAIGGGRITTLPDEALFPAIEGPPLARLKIGSLVPFGKPPGEHPYRTTVYLDATESENLSRTGIRFEIRDAQGSLLTDPYRNGEPLQPERSPNPGTPPALFLFKPPQPGTYEATILITNKASPEQPATAQVTVHAINTRPEAIPQVIAGPNPPQKSPNNIARASSGLQVVAAGTEVYLMGLGLDQNHAAPELYNPGGVAPDIYGKNHDHLQRQFGFRWQLFYTQGDDGSRTPAHRLLRDPSGMPATEGQLLHFTAGRAGRYEALLEVTDNDPFGSLASEPASVLLLAVDDNETHDGTACATCHSSEVNKYERTVHAEVGVGCERCHGPASAHLAVPIEDASYEAKKRATQDVSHESGVCGQCHGEYAEWEKSRHADGMPYGHNEIARPLLVQCRKCHYARGFGETVANAAEAGVTFHEQNYKKRLGGIGPLMPDLSKVPATGQAGISCTACHRPHDAVRGQSAGLRTNGPGALCQTCHKEKWQNAVLEGTAGEVHNGYEYEGEDYDVVNPHNTPAKCVGCHMRDTNDSVDRQGVRAVGGHTLRMRDAGANLRLGGFGPRADVPNENRNPEDSDDILNLAPCRDCHQGLGSFDRNGFQRDTHANWTRLGELLRSANSGILPGTRPGDKCATCHRGGTLPFDKDPSLLLEDAYTNYKLIRNDRSWGVHNPAYVDKLLADSIAAVESYLVAHATRGPD